MSKGQYVSLEGTRFAYEIAGEGEPLMLAHAGIADKTMWDEQFAFFARSFRVIRYDHRGFGETPMVEGAYAHYQDLRALLDYLNIEQAHFVGCSMGGCTILDFALAYPQRVRSLSIVTSTPNGYEFRRQDDASQAMLAAHVAAVRAGNTRDAADLEARYWVTGPRRAVEEVPASLLKRVCAMNRIAMANKVAYFKRASEYGLEPAAVDRLAEIHVPTLVLTGDLDDSNIIEGSAYMMERIAGAREAVMHGTAHFPNMERPAEFNQILYDFLKGESTLH